MNIYDYSNLLTTVRETNVKKIMAENERVLTKRAALLQLELELKESCLLADWYDLQKTCRETDIRIMPYGGWDELKKGPLMDDYRYFEDNGMFMDCISSGSHWADYFGFTYKDREFKWRIYHSTSSSLFRGFEDENTELDVKLKLIRLFMERYEEYRNIQLNRIYAKIGKVMEETAKIKKCMNGEQTW